MIKSSARFHYKTITCTNIELKSDFNILKNLNMLPRHYTTQLILYLKCMFADSVSGPCSEAHAATACPHTAFENMSLNQNEVKDLLK